MEINEEFKALCVIKAFLIIKKSNANQKSIKLKNFKFTKQSANN